MAWILIAYLYSGYHGGPVSAMFEDKAACEAAIQTLKAQIYEFRRGVCVPAATMPNGGG